ncbi:O-antigen ligase family protein [Candidatus Gottesmanbacteria bacterium]|nr:O-antigen ligase family protein [Candidatus Gottesmanbacteria bacterium]
MKPNRNSYLLFLFTSAALFLLQYVVDVKSYIAVVLMYGLGIFFLFKQTPIHTLFFLFLLTIPFEKGIREWLITIVPDGIESWMQGYDLYVGFTLKMIFTATLSAILLVTKPRPRALIPMSLIIFMICIVASTINASDTMIAFLGFTRITLGILLFLTSANLAINRRLRADAGMVFLALLLFFGYIGSGQQFRTQPLGLFLEDSASLNPMGYRTTDGDPLYRVSGFTGHPTFFASFLSLLLPIGLGYFLHAWKNKLKWITYISFAAIVLSGIALISTQSRSAWFAITVTTAVFLFRAYHQKDKKILRILTVGTCMITILIVIIMPTIINRLATIPDVWTTGSGNVRLLLMQEAWNIMNAFPLLGAGSNHFVRIMSSQELPVNLQGFLFPVHNTFLLFFAELGIPAGLAFLWFIIQIMIQTFRRAAKQWITLGVWLGALTFVINAQFHTLFNQDPTFDLFMVLLGFATAL